MSNRKDMMLLVGDNPFHHISHLSQERARMRSKALDNAESAAKLVKISIDNGASGFMFSVSETTLSILRILREKREIKRIGLYAIVPYAYDYVRLAAEMGVSGLAKKIVKDILISGNFKAKAIGLKAIINTGPADLMKAYLFYEISRIRSSVGRYANLESVILHEMITDMALALDFDWLFKSCVDLVSGLKIKPGFQTRNFVYLVSKLIEWGINLRDITIVAPFNKLGFQMSPSRAECEGVLAELSGVNVIAISILAAGYLKLQEAADYIKTLPRIEGVAVGVSEEHHAYETFRVLREILS